VCNAQITEVHTNLVRSEREGEREKERVRIVRVCVCLCERESVCAINK